MNRARERGFTLLEAIIALVLLASALAGAWTWIANDVRTLGRVRDLALEEAAVQQAVSVLEQVDLSAQPEGSIRWRQFRIDWSARALEPTRAGRTGVGGAGVYNFTLYGVALEVLHRERTIATPELRMVQYTRGEQPPEGP